VPGRRVTKPSYDDETLAAYFQPLDRSLWGDAVLGPLLRELKRTDPVLIEAVTDVDRSQIRDLLSMTPEARLRASWSMAASYEAIRRENDR
jgi:hypothetical protein